MHSINDYHVVVILQFLETANATRYFFSIIVAHLEVTGRKAYNAKKTYKIYLIKENIVD